MSDIILKISNVHKSFDNLKVLNGLDFEVKKNSIFGFVGKNGVGKTTTMKMILGIMKIDQGEITVLGEKVEFGKSIANKNIGYLPDMPEFYGYMTPKQYLKLTADLFGIKKSESDKRITDLLFMVGLDGVNKPIKGFSRGMKQRLGIAQALINKPKLLICDEPTSALDPIGRKEILEVMKNVSSETTIIFSTHILTDVERICDEIGVLNDGKMVLKGKVSEIKNFNLENKIEIELIDDAQIETLKNLIINDYPGYKIETNNKKIIVYYRGDFEFSRNLLKTLGNNSINIRKFELMEPNLEQLFMEVTN